MKDLFSLKDKIAVITGGLGQLGQQFSVTLVDYGAKVAVIDLSEAVKPRLSQFSRYQRDAKIICYPGDITNRESLTAILTEILKTWGDPHILINNAAIDSPPDAPISENGPFETYPESSLERIMDVNLKGTFITCQVFGECMAKNRRGSIINVGSIYGLVSPNQEIYEYKRTKNEQFFKPAPYSLTKSGIYNFTRYLATYWAQKGVRVNTITPGGIFNNQPNAFLAEYCRRVPMGRMANPDEMNGAIVFLASDASSYMTGSNLIVDGGWTAW